jgi:hypothetical protein
VDALKLRSVPSDAWDEDIVASDAQIQANRLNAQRSTGPQTENGKRAVRYNALKHGLLAEASLLPGEDTALFRRLAEEIHAQFEPVGELEQLLVDRITSCAWRLRRVLHVEAGLFVARLKYAITLKPKQAAGEELLALQQAIQPPPATVDDDQQSPAVRSTPEADDLRNDALSTLGRAFGIDASESNAFSKLARYESNIERALFRALQELQRLQSARLDDPAAPKQSSGSTAPYLDEPPF